MMEERPGKLRLDNPKPDTHTLADRGIVQRMREPPISPSPPVVQDSISLGTLITLQRTTMAYNIANLVTMTQAELKLTYLESTFFFSLLYSPLHNNIHDSLS